MKTIFRSQSPLLIRCHTTLSTNTIHCIHRRSFAHKDKLKILKRKLGLNKQKHFGPKRGAKGRAPGWLEQSNLVGPKVAIIGRTNVGKSTLFNRLAGKPIAIADNTAGVTRDRKEAQGKLVDLQFIMVDCPGIEELPSSDLKRRKIDLDSREQVMRGMIEQSQLAIQFADIIIFLYDAKIGINEEDRYIAKWLHKKLKLTELDLGGGNSILQSQLLRNNPHKRQLDGENENENVGEIDKKYVICVANKVEANMETHAIIAQGYELNLGQVIGLSCHSGDGFVDLFHAIDDVFQQMDAWRDKAVTQAYFDKYGFNNTDDQVIDNNNDEELTYIPLSQVHDMQSEYDKKHKDMVPVLMDAEHEQEFMEDMYADDFEYKYDGDVDMELDYDEINKEYDLMEKEWKELKNNIKHDDGKDSELNALTDTEMDKYNKIASVMTDVDIDDAIIDDDDLIDVNDANDMNEEELKRLFELKLCIVGRPNVGKSSLINSILGEHRCMVADIPGITRDSIAIPMYHKETGMNFKLIDTAGLLGLNKTSYEMQNEGSRLNILVLRECLRSIRFSNIIGIVIDINDHVLNTLDYLQLPKKLVYINNELRKLKLKNKQKYNVNYDEMNSEGDENIEYDELIESNELLNIDDESTKMDRLHYEAINAARSIVNSIIDPFDRQLIEYVISQGRGVVLVINKWDKITSKHQIILKLLKYSMPLVFKETGGIPICVTSAKYNKGINSFINNVINIYNKWNSRVPTPILNRFIFEMQKIYPPPAIKQIRKHGRWIRYIRPKVRYMTQYTIRPPSFICFCGTQIISDYYFYKLRRFLRNEFGLNGVPIRIKMRSNMDINKYDDEYVNQILQNKKKKFKKDKRHGRLRRLSLTEVLKLRKFRKDVNEYQNNQMGINNNNNNNKENDNYNQNDNENNG
eukprot:501920_1